MHTDWIKRYSQLIGWVALVGVMFLPAAADVIVPLPGCAGGYGCCYEWCDNDPANPGTPSITCVQWCIDLDDNDPVQPERGWWTPVDTAVAPSLEACEAKAKQLLDAKRITQGTYNDYIAACNGWDTREDDKEPLTACVLDEGSPFGVKPSGVQDGPDGFGAPEPGPWTMLALYLSRVVL